MLAYLTNCVREFYQIHNLGAVWHIGELLRFWVKKVKGEGHIEVIQAHWEAFSRLSLQYVDIF